MRAGGNTTVAAADFQEQFKLKAAKLFSDITRSGFWTHPPFGIYFFLLIKSPLNGAVLGQNLKFRSRKSNVCLIFLLVYSIDCESKTFPE